MHEKCRGMHEGCFYKLGPATARAAGASQTSTKHFLNFLTCLDVKKRPTTTKNNKNDITYMNMYGNT